MAFLNRGTVLLIALVVLGLLELAVPVAEPWCTDATGAFFGPTTALSIGAA